MSDLRTELLDVPRRAELLGGQTHSYVQLEAVLDAVVARRPRAWIVTSTGQDKHEAVFLSLPRALEYAVMHHGTMTELYQ